MAMKPLVLTPANFDCTDQQNEVYQEDANTLIRRIEGDILYLDPPYNVRQYGANYHILNTIANYNAFVPKGKTGLPPYKRSRYCSRVKVLDAFDYLLKNARFRYVFLSYNNEGLLSPETIRQTMSKYGRYDCIEMRNQRFKAEMHSFRSDGGGFGGMHCEQEKQDQRQTCCCGADGKTDCGLGHGVLLVFYHHMLFRTTTFAGGQCPTPILQRSVNRESIRLYSSLVCGQMYV